MRTSPALIALVLSVSILTPAFADTPLPSTLGTLSNPADQTITFGSATTTSSLTLENNASIINLGTWNAYAGTIAPDDHYTGPTFAASILNTGTLNINAGTGSLSILDFPVTGNPPAAVPVTFTNTGNVNLLSGAFNLAASDTGSSSGTITLSTGTTLGLAGNLTFDANSSITGAGDILISTNLRDNPAYGYIPNATNTQPTITFNGDYSTTGNTTIVGANVTFAHDTTLNNLQVSSGENPAGRALVSILACPGTLTVTGAGTPATIYTWTGGPSISGALISTPAIVVTGTLDLSSDGTMLIEGTTITVAPGAFLRLGNVPGQFDQLSFKNNATIVNNGTIWSDSWLLSADSSKPAITLTNNNTIFVDESLVMGHNTQFNNNGHVVLESGALESFAGTDSPSASIDNRGGFLYVTSRPFLQGSITNAAFINVLSGSTAHFGADLKFTNTGSVLINSQASLLLEAPQQPDTTGTFSVEPDAILEFATNYDFSSPTGPSFQHDPESTGDGLIIVDPGITLTLPSDTSFSGTIDVYGNLIIAPPLNAADAGLAPNFTVIYETPEPATLTLLALAPILVLRRKRQS